VSVLQHTYKKYILFYNIMSLLYLYRFLMRLKGDVRTKSHPEGSIIQIYIEKMPNYALRKHKESTMSVLSD